MPPADASPLCFAGAAASSPDAAATIWRRRCCARCLHCCGSARLRHRRSLRADEEPPSPGRIPAAKDASIGVNVFLIDANKNEVLLGTRIWPDYPEYNGAALQRYFALMKALEPTYKQDDNVAYTWSNKEPVTKCSIYLETFEAAPGRGLARRWGAKRTASAVLP